MLKATEESFKGIKIILINFLVLVQTVHQYIEEQKKVLKQYFREETSGLLLVGV